jgi:hypothetical protein
MNNHIFIAHGDLTQLAVDAVAYSSSTHLTADGDLYPAFLKHVAGFALAFGNLADKHAPCRVGDAFWLPMPGPALPRGVVVVAATGRSPGADFAQKSQLAVENALETAIAALRKVTSKDDRLLIALPTFRQGQGGDRHRRLESGQAQIAAAEKVLKRHAKVDVAFVTYTADSYQIYLQARRTVLSAPPCPFQGHSLANLEDAIRHRRCVLFLGAGLSQGAGLPSWANLVAQLEKELAIAAKGRNDLDYFLDLAQWYRERFGPERLADHIRATFACDSAKPTLAHYLLLSLPVRQVVTTNYDDLIEKTLTAVRRYPIKISRREDVIRTGEREGVCVVKLHGDVADADDIVLSRDDFDGFFRDRPAMAALLEGLLLNQTFFFVGYGLRDPNFRQIHDRIAAMLEDARREAYAVTVDASSDTSALLAAQWKRKSVLLLQMPGTDEERVHNALRFYDWLADRATSDSSNLFLATDVEYRGGLGPLRQVLMENVGEAIEDLFLRAEWSGVDPLHVAAVLGFLADQGWRPKYQALSICWAKLAELIDDPAIQRRLLITALRHTERADWANQIGRALDSLKCP